MSPELCRSMKRDEFLENAVSSFFYIYTHIHVLWCVYIYKKNKSTYVSKQSNRD